MPTSSLPPSPPFQMKLRVRLSKRSGLFADIIEHFRQLRVGVEVSEPIRETPAFVIREMMVSCQDRGQGEAILKTVRAIKGAEIMDLSLIPSGATKGNVEPN